MTLFVSNTIASNGGTTFLIRVAKYCYENNKPITILVVYKNVNEILYKELNEFAKIIFLSDLCSFKLPIDENNILQPLISLLDKTKVTELLRDFKSIHVMGIFGYVIAKRLVFFKPQTSISVGIYHQNEFLYKSRNVFFNRWITKEISNLKPENIIFFNEFTRNTYQRNFNELFGESSVLPIGIPFKGVNLNQNPDYKEFSITSVGNLVGFKTYNKHLINFVAKYYNVYPLLEYNIYGQGEEEESLKKLVKDLRIVDRIHFLGQLDYSKFDEVVSQSHLFVGSGTAVLEAANCGVPAIVGIESCEDPITYGYISDIEGFDYNEYDPLKSKVNYSDIITKLFNSDKEKRMEVARKCKVAVERFNISNTMHGFDVLESKAKIQDETPFTIGLRLRATLSFFYIALLDLLKIDQRFKFRRNQGSF